MQLGQPRFKPSQPGRLVAPVALVAGMLLGACSDSPTADSTNPSTIASTTTIPARLDDGVLTIGLMVPNSGSGVDLGIAVEAGTDLAVRQINVGGGVNGRTLRLIRQDEGDDVASARLASNALINAGVDAILGPASSLDALALVTDIAEAGIVSCSPTASSLALDEIPDEGLFFRTIGSDSLQALALAEAADRTGATDIAVVYIDDDYGRPLATQTAAALRSTGLRIVLTAATQGLPDDIDQLAANISKLKPSAVVVIADAETGPAIVVTLDRRLDGLPNFVVNEAMRRPSAAAAPYSAALAARITGVSPLATPPDDFLNQLRTVSIDTVGNYASNAYDCVNLIALASEMADSDNPSEFAPLIDDLSIGGTACASFAECYTALQANRNFQYNGPTGVLDLGQRGDPFNAVFDLFGFDENGRDVSLAKVIVTQ